jgi:hypothetical protein
MGLIFDEEAAPEQPSKELSPPPRVVSFVRRVIRGEKFYGGPERRVNLRYPLTMPVKVTPLNNDQMPSGTEPFLAVTRDISVGGLCLYYIHEVKEKYLQLELSSPNHDHLDVVIEVVRCRQAGPFWEIAGPFVGYA